MGNGVFLCLVHLGVPAIVSARAGRCGGGYLHTYVSPSYSKMGSQPGEEESVSRRARIYIKQEPKETQGQGSPNLAGPRAGTILPFRMCCQSFLSHEEEEERERSPSMPLSRPGTKSAPRRGPCSRQTCTRPVRTCSRSPPAA